MRNCGVFRPLDHLGVIGFNLASLTEILTASLVVYCSFFFFLETVYCSVNQIEIVANTLVPP